MSGEQDHSGWDDPKPTALLVLADGTVLEGFGLGATGHAVGEVCCNTAMSVYEEILTDPSYAGQIITFTFPHIGNVGTNEEDIETVNLAATPGKVRLLIKAKGKAKKSLAKKGKAKIKGEYNSFRTFEGETFVEALKQFNEFYKNPGTPGAPRK